MDIVNHIYISEIPHLSNNIIQFIQLNPPPFFPLNGLDKDLTYL